MEPPLGTESHSSLDDPKRPVVLYKADGQGVELLGDGRDPLVAWVMVLTS